MHSRKFLTIIPSIIDHKLWITSSTFKSWHKKKTRFQLKHKFSSLNFKKKQTNKYRHFKLRFESLQKHKQDSLNIKAKTRHNEGPRDWQNLFNILYYYSTGVKKIVRYTGVFAVYKLVILRFYCTWNQNGPPVLVALDPDDHTKK